MVLFGVLRGEKSIGEANLSKVYTVDTKEWKRAETWVDWWIRKRHLCKYIEQFSAQINFVDLHSYAKSSLLYNDK